MKTLIINGSTRRGGNTDALLAEFAKNLVGEYMTVTCDDDVAPCRNCGYCKTHAGCAVNDRMTEVYQYMEDCDNIVIASPVWFMTLTGTVIDIASRFQIYWEAVHRRGESETELNCAILLVGAIPGTEAPAIKAAGAIFKTIGARLPAAAVVTAMNTDSVAVCDDEKALADAKEAAMILNGLDK